MKTSSAIGNKNCMHMLCMSETTVYYNINQTTDITLKI